MFRSHSAFTGHFDLTGFPQDIAGEIISYLPFHITRSIFNELKSLNAGQLHPLFPLLVSELTKNIFSFQNSELSIPISELMELSSLCPQQQCPLKLKFKFDSYNEHEASQLVELLENDLYWRSMRNLHVDIERDDFFQNGVYNFCQAAHILAPCISRLTIDLSPATHKLMVAHTLKSLEEFQNLKLLLLTYMGLNEELPEITLPESIIEMNVKTGQPGLFKWPESLESLTCHQNLKCMDLSNFTKLKTLKFYQNCSSDSIPCILPPTLKCVTLVNTSTDSLEQMRINCLNLQSLTLKQLPFLHRIDIQLPNTLKSLLIEDCPIGASPQNLSNLPDIRTLTLRNTHLHNETLACLSLPNLESLLLFEPQLKVLPDLRSLKNLETLTIESCGVTELNCEILPRNLGYCQITSNEKFSMISDDLPHNLVSLSLANAMISGTSIPTNLESLHLSYSELQIETPRLRDIQMHNCDLQIA